MSLDSQSWIENGETIRLTQDGWIEKYNQAGKIMAAFPDIYHAVKEENDELITSLQVDFGKWIITSTRLQFNPNTLEGKIIHYHGSTVVEPRESELIIPVFLGNLIETAILTGADSEQGLVYLQTLCDTQDSAEEIIKNFERLSGKTKGKIKIWTPPLQSNQWYTRSERSDRAAFAGFDLDGFNFSCYLDLLINIGRSRGVDICAAGACADERVSGSNRELPYNIQSGISRKTHSVHFSTVQEIGDFEKYTGMFCFEDGRYLVSLIRREGKKITDKKVAVVLSGKKGIDEKIKELNKFNPTYAHIIKFIGDKLVDDVELFGGLER